MKDTMNISRIIFNLFGFCDLVIDIYLLFGACLLGFPDILGPCVLGTGRPA